MLLTAHAAEGKDPATLFEGVTRIDLVEVDGGPVPAGALRRLRDGVEGLEGGGSEPPPALPGATAADEVGDLARSVTAMADPSSGQPRAGPTSPVISADVTRPSEIIAPKRKP